ncbi:MAG: TetR/AcrR family transcriptional regulator [Actinomycetota bacterium]
MPRPRATPEQRERERQRLRRAAAEIYREDGIGAVSVRSVTQRAGVSQGALYNSFESLSDLMSSLWTGTVDRANEQLRDLVAAHPDPLERVRAILAAYVDFARDHPDLHRDVLLAVRRGPIPEPLELESVPVFAQLRAALTEAVEDGIVDGDPHAVAMTLWAGVHGALALPVNFSRFPIDPDDTLAVTMIDALMATLVRDEP